MVAGLIWLDVAVILAFGVVLATVATTPHLVFLAGVGFMVIARSASTIVKLLQSEGELVVRGAEWYQHGLQWVQWLIPDLGALDVRPIALYGKMEFLSATVWALIVMPLAYIIVLLAIACLRFGKRQFN
jgi:ABC-type transport system involved in multi-copper enzyme maturation permease subunit